MGAVVQSVGKVSFTGATGAGAVTITFGANLSGTNFVAVPLEFFSGTSTAVSGITAAGTAMAARKQGNPTGTNQADIWDVATNAGGSPTVSISFGTGAHDGFASALEFASTGSDGKENSIAQAASLAPSVSSSAASSQANTLSLAVSSSGSASNPNTYTQPVGWTGLGTEVNGATNNSGATAYFEDTVAQVETATWAETNSATTTNVIVVYKTDRKSVV